MKKSMSASINIQVTTLENGVIVATDIMPGVRSASLGVYLDIGSRDEKAGTNGLAHLFEHMVFKGTQNQNALEIVKSFEASGGQVNAYTSKEQTSFYAKVIDNEVPRALSTLLDMVLSPLFDNADLEKEREVIIEEIRGGKDNPEDYIYDLYSDAFYGSQSLGYPIAGTEKSVRGLQRKHLVWHQDLVAQKYPVYVLAVGNVSHAEIVEITRQKYALSKKAKVGTKHLLRKPLLRKASRPMSKHLDDRRKVEQATVLIGGPGYAWDHNNRFALLLLNSILGDGMSSRLFQNLREAHGLVYNIYSSPEFLIGTGTFSIGFATEAKNLQKAFLEISREIKALKKDNVQEKDLDFAKKNVCGSILLSLESTYSRMGNLSRQIMYRDKSETLDVILKKIEAVNLQDIKLCIRDIFKSEKWSSALIASPKAKVDIAKALDF